MQNRAGPLQDGDSDLAGIEERQGGISRLLSRTLPVTMMEGDDRGTSGAWSWNELSVEPSDAGGNAGKWPPLLGYIVTAAKADGWWIS